MSTEKDKALPPKENKKDVSKPSPPEDLPIEPEVLDKLPPETRKRLIESWPMISMAGPMHPPFFRKINEEHITKLIEYSEKDSERGFEDSKSSRRYRLCYFILALALFVFLIMFLSGRNDSLLKDLLTTLIGVGGGFGAGYGYKAYISR